MTEEKQPQNENLGEYKPQTEQPTDYQVKSEPPEPEEEGSKQPSLPPVLNKKLIIIAGIIVVIILAYFIFTPKKQTLTQAQTTPAPKAVQPAVLASAQITTLQQQAGKNSNDIKGLKEQAAQMRTSINELKNIVYTLNSATQKLSQNVLQLSVKREPKAPAKQPQISYHIRAIVPGRAWLESKDGVIVTVSPGSKLKGYGTVKEIDAAKGIVKTSKGFNIHYGSNDT